MNALLDTNVVVDVLLQRTEFYEDSAAVLNSAERGGFNAWLGATTLTTIYYLVNRKLGHRETIKRMNDLSAICATAPVNHAVIQSALESSFSDFEDAILYHAAMTAGVNCIVTRNAKDFCEAEMLVCTPSQFLALL